MYYGKQEIIQVCGENGANAYPLPMPNSSALLLDNQQPIVWFVSTDGAGYKSVKPYKIEPYTPPSAVDMNDILKRLEKLENEQSNTTTARTTKRKAEPISTDSEQS